SAHRGWLAANPRGFDRLRMRTLRRGPERRSAGRKPVRQPLPVGCSRVRGTRGTEGNRSLPRGFTRLTAGEDGRWTSSVAPPRGLVPAGGFWGRREAEERVAQSRDEQGEARQRTGRGDARRPDP